MNWSLALILVLTCCWTAVPGTECSHILGVFVNVHRSQLIVHLSVARVLLQRGHQLTLVTSLPLEQDDWINGNITHILVDWQLEKQQQQLTEYNDNFVGRLQRTLSRLEQSGEFLSQSSWLNFMHATPTTPYDLLLLGYHFNDHLLGVAAHFNCPVAIVTTQQPIGFVHSLLGNPEERWYVPQPYDSRQRIGFEGWILGVWEKCSEYLARRVMQSIYSTHFPTPLYPTFEEMRLRVSLALNNHHMISEGPIAPMLPSMLDIGGIVMEQAKVLDGFDVGKRSIIIFSLGTRFSWQAAPLHLERIFVDAFAKLEEYDICWTYDGANASRISMAHNHIKLNKWWPQAQLLSHPHARLFITHGGKGSLSEALYYGVPLLGLPLLGDQRPNLSKVKAKGWGLTLDIGNLDQVKLLETIKNLLIEESFRQRIRKDSLLYKDRAVNASALTAYWLEYVIRHKGAPHLSGNAKHLTIWQQHLLDVRLLVYGVVFLISWTALWLAIK